MVKQIKLKNIVLIIVSMVLWCTSGFRIVFADETYMWPVISDVQVDSTGGNITIWWTTVPITLTEEELDSPACFGERSCSTYVFFHLKKFGTTIDGTGNFALGIPYVSNPENKALTWRGYFTLGNFAPGSKSNNAPNFWYRDSCYRIGVITSSRLISGVWPSTHPWSGINDETSVPPGVAPVNSGDCVGTPPLNASCEPDMTSLEFDFGDAIKASSASGMQRSKDITVRCTTDMKFKLFLHQQNTTAGSISLNNGMESILSINGETLSDSIQQGVNGTVNIPLTVTLTGKPESEGPFTGSGVLGISYP